MKAFKEAIKSYLDKRANEDPLFAESYKKESKNLDGCVNYILSEVQKIAKEDCAVMTDDEVFCLAVHYYDEDTAKADKPVNARVVISGEYVPSQKITQSAERDNVKNMAKPKAVKNNTSDKRQLSLFGF